MISYRKNPMRKSPLRNATDEIVERYLVDTERIYFNSDKIARSVLSSMIEKKFYDGQLIICHDDYTLSAVKRHSLKVKTGTYDDLKKIKKEIMVVENQDHLGWLIGEGFQYEFHLVTENDYVKKMAKREKVDVGEISDMNALHDFTLITDVNQIDKYRNAIIGGLGSSEHYRSASIKNMKKVFYTSPYTTNVIAIGKRSKSGKRLGSNGQKVTIECSPGSEKAVMPLVKKMLFEERSFSLEPKLRVNPEGTPFVNESGNYLIDSGICKKYERGFMTQAEITLGSIDGVVDTNIYAVHRPNVVVVARKDKPEIFGDISGKMGDITLSD